MTLTSQEILALLHGSSFFACGGGVPTSSSATLLSSFGAGASLQLRSLDDFGSNDLLCSVYAIGAAGAAKKNYNSLLAAFDHLEKQIGGQIVGVVPGEIGSEINALWVAHHRRIAVVDSDMVGGRAVPEEQMDIHTICGVPTTPTLVANDHGDVIVVNSAKNPTILEAVYRAFAIASGGYCYVAGRPMSASAAGEILPRKTISRAIALGARVLACTSARDFVDAAKECCGSVLLGTGRISEIHNQEKPGFNAGSMTIEGSGEHEGRYFQIFFQNENILLLDGELCICSVPDLVTLVNSNTLRPIHNSSLELGAEVLVFGTPALPIWKSARARTLLQPSHFGFDYDHIPLETDNR